MTEIWIGYILQKLSKFKKFKVGKHTLSFAFFLSKLSTSANSSSVLREYHNSPVVTCAHHWKS